MHTQERAIELRLLLLHCLYRWMRVYRCGWHYTIMIAPLGGAKRELT